MFNNLQVVNVVVKFLINQKRRLFLSFQNTGFSFHYKIRLSYIRYQTLHRRIHNLVVLSLYPYSQYVPGFKKYIKAFPIVLMVIKTITAGYIINCLLAAYYLGPYTIYNLLQLNYGIISLA